MKYLFGKVKGKIKKMLKHLPITKEIIWGNTLYEWYRRNHFTSRKDFLIINRRKFFVQPISKKKAIQITKLLNKVDIVPVENEVFFYSLDCFKTAEVKYCIFDNYSIDYSIAVNGSFKELKDALSVLESEFAVNECVVIDAYEQYLNRCRENEEASIKYARQFEAAGTLFERPARSFFEALQRILFLNQFLWQTGHRLNGLGHLDWILIDLYREDIESGQMTENEADEMLKEFFRVLHEYYWFKSSGPLGDTGQIIVLGGLGKDEKYCCNELTYKLIRISQILKLPDPKVLLRCSYIMPEDLLEKALECIATGIGAPLLTNDDMVIPALKSYGYDTNAAYGYVTSACWEPLVLGNSSDQNNMACLNFAKPFVEMLDCADLDAFVCIDDVVACYEEYLVAYIGGLLSQLSKIKFDEDPILSMFSESSVRRGKDLLRGGAEYSNIGLTSVGMGCVVNSLLNVDRLVFKTKKYALTELNTFRRENYIFHEDIQKELKDLTISYGSDVDVVVNLTRHIVDIASGEFGKYSTYLGGKFKFGLSSPGYISEAQMVEATLDGRRKGEPFGVHISSVMPIAPTELISFATRLDYTGCRLNGNVVDFIVAPSVLISNLKKYAIMLRAAFGNGLYQLQMNVLDSKTLIAAKENPSIFPNLIVRVWGFSAYFSDLPEAYQDVLIARALESEKAA